MYAKPQKPTTSSIPTSSSPSTLPTRSLPSVQHGHTSSLPSISSKLEPTPLSTVSLSSNKGDSFKQESLARSLTDKISLHSQDLANKLSVSVDKHLGIHRQLTENSHKLDAYLSRLETDQKHLERNIQILSKGNSEMRQIISDIQKMPPIDVDVLATQQPVLFNQMLELVSDDRAIDDVLYQFTRSYSTEKMELSLFLKVISLFYFLILFHLIRPFDHFLESSL